jgi:hypothetical protein
MPEDHDNATPPPQAMLDESNTVDLRKADNLRDVLTRLQAKLQAMGNVPDDEELDEIVTSVSEITRDLETLHTAPNEPTLANEKPDMNSDTLTEQLAVKVDREARQILRRIQAHLLNAQIALGAEHNVVNLVEVIHHPENPIPSLNYVTPRQKTAWVSADQVRRGMDYLSEQGRTPRVCYIEGLLPPLFARNLRQLNLTVETETPLMVFAKDGLHGNAPPEVTAPNPPYNLHLETVSDVRGAEVWWYVWQNAHYDVLTLGVEPLFVGRTVAEVTMGHQIDIIVSQASLPFGVARVTVYEDTAHIVSTAIFKEQQSPKMTRLLRHAALYEALQRGCSIVFASGETDVERETSRGLGFMDFGSVVCYAAPINHTETNPNDDTRPLVQPILNLR